MQEHDEEVPPQVQFSFGQKAAIFVPAALSVCGLDALLHAPLPLAVAGMVGAYCLAKNSPQLYGAMKEHLPLPEGTQGRRPVGDWTLTDRLLGRHYIHSRQEEDASTRAEERPSQEESGSCVDEPSSRQPDPLPTARFGRNREELPPPAIRSNGPLLFSSVLSRFTPTLDRIYLASTTDGLDLFCAAEELCHVALAGSTGAGKSSIMRLLMAQLCNAGAHVLLLNPHYTKYDLKRGEDWTPFEPYLMYDPMQCRKYDVIEHYLKHAAEVLLPRRLEKYAHSLPVGKPYFLVLDELPSIVRHIKKAPEYIRELLEEGRKVGIFLICASQDFLVRTIAPDAGGGSIRECYRTAYYVGGDATTARVLLDMEARKIPEDHLGKGPVMLRCAALPQVKQARLSRVPYVDNVSLYQLLGPSTYQPSQEAAQSGHMVHEEHGGVAQRAATPLSEVSPLPRRTISPSEGVAQRATAPLSERENILDTIVTLSAAGTLDERTLMRLIELLPTVRTDEAMQQPPQESRPAAAVSSGPPVPRMPEEGPGTEQTESSGALPQRTSRHQEKFARYITIWQALEEKQSATLRDFAKAAGLNEGKAYTYLSQMADAGLIRWQRRKKQAL